MKAVTIWRAGRCLPAPSRTRLRRMTAAAAGLAGLHDVPGGVCVSFLSPAGIERVNEDFLGHHGPTDVISFDYRAEDDPGFASANETDAFDAEDDGDADPSIELIVCPAVAEFFDMDEEHPNYELRISRDNWTLSCAAPAVWELLDYLTENYSIDSNRIYGSGQSMAYPADGI